MSANSYVNNDNNVKNPLLKYDEDNKGVYPFFWSELRADGSLEVRNLNPGLESFHNIEASGTYHSVGPAGEHSEVKVGTSHSYNIDSVSDTTDGHHDAKISGSHRQNVDGGTHKETGEDHSELVGGQKVSASKDTSVNVGASGDRFEYTEGSFATNHKGNVSHAYEGDYVNQVTGNKVDLLSSGEYMIHVQSGNMDCQIDDGKLNIAVNKDITVSSTTSITFSVGDQKMILTPSGLTIQVSALDIKKV